MTKKNYFREAKEILVLLVMQPVGFYGYLLLAIVSILFAIAPCYSNDASLVISLNVLVWILPIYAVLVFSYKFFSLACDAGKDSVDLDKNSDTSFHAYRFIKSILLSSLVMLLLWLPYAICLYPGIVFFDTSYQLSQFFGNPNLEYFPMYDGASLSDHHPLFDTLLFGLFVKFGALTSSANVGMYTFLLVQAVLTATSLSLLAVYMRSVFRVRRGLFIGTILFFSLCPIIPIFVFSMTKDSIFSWLYVLLFLQVVEIIRTKGCALGDFKFFVCVIVVALLAGLTKKTGIYLVFLAFFLLCFSIKKNRLKLLCAAVTPFVVASILMPLLLFPVLNVSPGSKVELLGFFYQQSARYAVDYSEDVTFEEQKALSNVLGYDELALRYAPGITNPIKSVESGVNCWPTNIEITTYFRSYFTQGLRHPDAYFNAVASLEAGWFDWSKTMHFSTDSGMPRAYIQGEPNIERAAWAQQNTDYLNTALVWMEEFSLIAVFLKMPLYAVLIPVFFTLRCISSCREYRPLLFLILASMLILFVSPVSSALNMEAQRYLLPFVYTSPALVMLCTVSSPATKCRKEQFVD